ncbi:hypothetical protein WJX81_003518 [Elliptochloris bilobata]|uniref:Uncharacterized protein n=1 Tax=Elliptochloris bilobata TaxID=381761 RepID=A0AAW1SJC6_9CHLO
MCLCSAATAFILYVRPLLRKAERATLACERAAQEMERACISFDKASEVLHSELPTTLDAMERASLEFDELGRSLNMLASPLRRLPARQHPRAEPSADGAKLGAGANIGAGVGLPLAGLSAVTASGIGAVSGAGEAGGQAMRRLAAELAVLTRALTPAMEGWRRRIGRLTASFEQAGHSRNAARLLAEQNAQDAQQWHEHNSALRYNQEGSASGSGSQVLDGAAVEPLAVAAAQGEALAGAAEAMAKAAGAAAAAAGGGRCSARIR